MTWFNGGAKNTQVDSGDGCIRGIELKYEHTTIEFKGEPSLLTLMQNLLIIHGNKVEA